MTTATITKTYLPSATGMLAVYVPEVGWIRVKQLAFLQDTELGVAWVPEKHSR